MIDTGKYGPMTHDDLGEALKEATGWALWDRARVMVVRLVCEIYRLRQGKRLQRRSIERLEELLHDATHPAPESAIPVAALVGAEALPGPSMGKRIESAADFIETLGNAIEAGELPGVLGVDDEGAAPDNGGRLLTLLLNDEHETRVLLTVREVTRG